MRESRSRLTTWRQMQVNRRYAHLTSLLRASIFILINYFYWNKHFTREAQRRQTKHLPNSLSSKLNTKIELIQCMCSITWPEFEIRFGWRQCSHEIQTIWWCITHFSFAERIHVVDFKKRWFGYVDATHWVVYSRVIGSVFGGKLSELRFRILIRFPSKTNGSREPGCRGKWKPNELNGNDRWTLFLFMNLISICWQSIRH